MKCIPSTRGFEIIVDDGDFDRLTAVKWHALENGRTKICRPARNVRKGGRKTIYLHHEILPPKAGLVIDHINGDVWDNRRSNLRYCTNAENLRNRHHPLRGDLPKGVHRKGRRFVTYITFEGRRHCLGGFATIAEASAAYDTAALRLHGQFACLNNLGGNVAARPKDFKASHASPNNRKVQHDHVIG